MKEKYIPYNLEKSTSFKIVTASAKHKYYAGVVSGWTQEAGTMLPKQEEEILELFHKGHSILVFDNNGSLMSHAAATYVYPDGTVEIGAVFTAVEHRGKGAATQAVCALIPLLKEKYPKSTLFALANPISAKLFEKMGAFKMETSKLPSEVWEPCALCPKRGEFNPEGSVIFHCCDTPYNLTDI